MTKLKLVVLAALVSAATLSVALNPVDLAQDVLNGGMVSQKKIKTPPNWPQGSSPELQQRSFIAASWSIWVYGDKTFGKLGPVKPSQIPYCPEDGWSVVYYYRAVQLSVEVAVLRRGSEVVVTCRGSQEPQDWGFDTVYKLIPATGLGTQDRPCRDCGRVHAGFHLLTVDVWNRVAKIVRDLEAKGSNPPLTYAFVGHSLGGAMSTLGAVFMRQNNILPRERVALYTFGCPMAGDAQFKRKAESLLDRARVFRFEDHMPLWIDKIPPVNGVKVKKEQLRDIITHFPPNKEYKHVYDGIIVYCKCHDMITCNQGMAHKMKSYVGAMSRWKEQVGRSKCPAKPDDGGSSADQSSSGASSSAGESSGGSSSDGDSSSSEAAASSSSSSNDDGYDFATAKTAVHFRSGYNRHHMFDYWNPKPGHEVVNAGRFTGEHLNVPKFIEGAKQASGGKNPFEQHEIVVSAYASVNGKSSANRRLTKRRARGLSCFLIKWCIRNGIPTGKIRVAWHGEDKSSPGDAKQIASDRRVDVFWADNQKELAVVDVLDQWTFSASEVPSHCKDEKEWIDRKRFSDRFYSSVAAQQEPEAPRKLKCKSKSTKIYGSANAGDQNPRIGKCPSSGYVFEATSNPANVIATGNTDSSKEYVEVKLPSTVPKRDGKPAWSSSAPTGFIKTRYIAWN
eukprot:TRINITY_DN66420_c0_g3_i1.p1 TRINITY_DN66420_c0_g3~~TRINITY_DN66420_c0_g3_i1.p1  ORF type:complete len:708 (-),score=361.95 TRINITY_DN66420_c0_g3_i1:517-2544(-)